MTDFKDYYEILGVDRGASQDDVQKAYRKLARKYHPDVNREAAAEDRFKEVGEAYEVLKDPEKRKKYDRFGHAWKQAQQRTGGAPPGWENVRVEYGPGFDFDFGGAGGGRGGGDAEAFSSLFEQLFGGRAGGGGRGGGRDPFGGGFAGFQARAAGPRAARRGGDVEAEVELGLEEAARGGKRQVTLADPETGQRQTLEVTIPPGIQLGKKLRLGGQGGEGLGGAGRGDLLLKVRIAPHPRFRLDGRDLHTKLEVAPWEAALGGEAEVPTLDGSQRVRIPAGTSSGRRIRLRGKGFPGSGGKPAGDLFAEVSIAVPKELSERERELFEELAETSGFRPRG
jgi:curved DNA-binding protein